MELINTNLRHCIELGSVHDPLNVILEVTQVPKTDRIEFKCPSIPLLQILPGFIVPVDDDDSAVKEEDEEIQARLDVIAWLG